MAELSIIVPIYNVEEYLPRCIDSILAQTYTDFELILINDGSPDNCAEIMEQYVKADERIITIYQENKGVSAARNAGLRIAKGKYIGFIDPDDYIERDFFSLMITAIEATKSDIAVCNWDSFCGDGCVAEHIVEIISDKMTKKQFVNHIFDSPRTVAGSNWNKLFLREKIEKFYDENLTICEDNLFLLDYCKNIGRACYVNKVLYHIFQRPNSATRKDVRKITLGLSVRERMIDIARGIDKECGSYAEKDYLDSCYLHFKQFVNEQDNEYSVKARSALSRYIKENFWGVLLNPKIYWKTKLLYFYEAIFRS